MPPSSALTLTVSLTLGLLGLSLHRFLEHRTLGSLRHIHTQDTLYDKSKYGHILDFDKHSLILHGQPTLILAGEFHYWRLPDRSRWRPILEQYRSAGLNCIRIYFHWGFHSPAEGTYNFDQGSNRDIDYLLNLCEELSLYVLAAPGPYICAETQAGGFPIWLAAKREIRLRHMSTNFWKVYDPTFMAYCVEYFEQILPFLAKHQITNGDNGCVLALQIENEAFQHVFGYPFGCHDDMRVLAKTARDCGITVPLFTNDGFEQGSFIVKADPKRTSMDFGIDLYGFDKYVVFTPNSEPTSWVLSRDPSHLEEWSPSTVTAELDSMEHKVRSFGHANQRTPIFIPELQGGWFNHYGIKYTYDAIYKFYGDQYTRLMLDTVIAQGCTMLNFYMFYGGTNWGTLGDPACIREYGLMSGRLRKLRLGLLFLQSFADIMVKTDAVPTSQAVLTVHSSLKNTICQQRQSYVRSTHLGPVQLIFMRNFSEQKLDRFELSTVLNCQEADSGKGGANTTKLSCYLPYKASFIALGNYPTLNPDIHLVLSATPIVLRAFSRDGNKEIWIAALAGGSSVTEMAFRGDVFIKHAGVQTVGLASQIKLRQCLENKQVSILSVPEGAASAHVVLSSVPGSSSSSKPLLHIIFLDQSSLATLYCHYDNCHGKRAPVEQLDNKNMASSPKIITWGSYNARYNSKYRELTVESTERQEKLHILSFEDPDIPLLNTGHHSAIFGPDLPYRLLEIKATPAAELALRSTALWVKRHQNGIDLHGWEKRHTDFKSFAWKNCPRQSPSSDVFRNVSLDYHFTSGHILYRGRFKTYTSSHLLSTEGHSSVRLKVNMRHRVIAYVNGICLGSHMTYSRQLLSPGAKMGWDPAFLGSHRFLVMPHALEAATSRQAEGKRATDGYPETESAKIEQEQVEHEIILVIDSFGLSRQPFVVDDIRNPRGLLSARVQGKAVVPGSESWQVAGVDVRELAMAYESTGFPDEHSEQGWQAVADSDENFDLPRVVPDQGVTWWRMRFEGAPTSSANIPLCCRLEGDFSAMILLNNVLVGRYFGADSPQQDFYLMDGLLHASESGQSNELKLMVYSSNESESLHAKTSVRILPWRVEDAQGELAQWSGNTLFNADEDQSKEAQAGAFWTFRQTVPYGREA
ncbi:hypothetical protein EC968_003839 [Mortierella alpina]|nr:hypothetical protein EC968_003839 [Mortierella alpina]